MCGEIVRDCKILWDIESFEPMGLLAPLNPSETCDVSSVWSLITAFAYWVRFDAHSRVLWVGCCGEDCLMGLVAQMRNKHTQKKLWMCICCITKNKSFNQASIGSSAGALAGVKGRAAPWLEKSQLLGAGSPLAQNLSALITSQTLKKSPKTLFYLWKYYKSGRE